ncbi:TonB-dependent receptor [candidate division KSB1 bacterium]|nr:TonB-dependent receptor [candidate division KSB1 bacterium]
MGFKSLNREKKPSFRIMICNVFLIFIMLITIPTLGAEKVAFSGEVTDAKTGEPLIGTNVRLEGTVWGASTNSEGHFTFECPAGSYRLVAQHIGYKVFSKLVTIRSGMPALKISLNEAPIALSEVVITATRTPTPVNDIPANVSVLSSASIEAKGSLSLDDALVAEPGVDVRRASGIFTMSPTLVLRGTGANEPSRTLVLLDGVPINKSDTGESNWNRIKTETLERVEIVRGPASALYGSNAMGGVINLITKKPDAGIHAKVNLQGGSLGTAGVDLSLSGGKILGEDQFIGFYLNGNYLTSDGYISEPLIDRTEYTVKRFLDENSQTAKLMYINGTHEITATYQRYDDERGEGEKIQAPDGEFRDFDTDFFTLQYIGSSSRWHWETRAFYQLEKYARIDERMRGAAYERFDVLSDRIDQGFLSSISFYSGKLGRLSLGIDVKQGSVDGADTYRTSPDIVANRGTLTMLSGFIQDEISLFQNRVNVVAGLRLDQVKFEKGEINSTLAPWDTYNGNLDSHTWEAISPRFGVNYQMLKDTRLYASVGKAFRGSILDDLCRSGWMWVGPKIANPYLEPETMTNTELGIQQNFGRALLKFTGYYAVGKDFLYYLETEQTIFGGRFVLMQRQNVARVIMQGIETSAQSSLGRYFDLSAGLTISKSAIEAFPERKDLTGKLLTYSPGQKAKISLGFDAFIDGSVTWEWVGKQYNDDLNTDVISAYDAVHINVSKRLTKSVCADLWVRNLFDTQYLQSEIALDPGRIIMGTLSFAH